MTEEDKNYNIEEDNSLIEEKIFEEDIKPVRKLDYTLETPEERRDLVAKIIEETPREQLTNRYIEILTDYIIFAMDKEERKKKKILTDNRMITVNKRETSFQGLASRLENGEDGIYNMIANDKNIIFMPKVSITQKDIDEIPELKRLREVIEKVEAQAKAATGKRKYLLMVQLKEMRQEQYIIKNSYKQPIYFMNAIKSFHQVNLDEKVIINQEQEIESNGLVTLLNKEHISILLCNYTKLKEESWGKLWCDLYFLMEDLDSLIEETLKEEYPLYYDLLIYKIDGKQNLEIQTLLNEKHGVKHSVEYISSLWRNKIPKLLAERAQNNYLIWHYTMRERGKWKKCSRCGEIKLAHNRFFSKNKSSKDGFYSICKKCRNKKK